MDRSRDFHSKDASTSTRVPTTPAATYAASWQHAQLPVPSSPTHTQPFSNSGGGLICAGVDAEGRMVASVPHYQQQQRQRHSGSGTVVVDVPSSHRSSKLQTALDNNRVVTRRCQQRSGNRSKALATHRGHRRITSTGSGVSDQILSSGKVSIISLMDGSSPPPVVGCSPASSHNPTPRAAAPDRIHYQKGTSFHHHLLPTTTTTTTSTSKALSPNIKGRQGGGMSTQFAGHVRHTFNDPTPLGGEGDHEQHANGVTATTMQSNGQHAPSNTTHHALNNFVAATTSTTLTPSLVAIHNDWLLANQSANASGSLSPIEVCSQCPHDDEDASHVDSDCYSAHDDLDSEDFDQHFFVDCGDFKEQSVVHPPPPLNETLEGAGDDDGEGTIIVGQ